MGKTAHRNIAYSTAEYTRTYSNIRGVDFSDPTGMKSKERLPYLENMYRDYSAGDYMLESIPGFRRLHKLNGKVNGMFSQKVSEGEEYVLIHAGTSLYRFSVSERDSGETLSPIASLANARSCGFSYGDSIYILDGTNIHVAESNGTVKHISENRLGDLVPYIPTRYKNGDEYEQDNLLTSKFKESTSLADYLNLTHGTPGLIYSKNPDGNTFSVVGADETVEGIVYVPARIKVADQYKSVTRIADMAFSANNKIEMLYINNGLEEIGSRAFENCPRLRLAVIANTVRVINNRAFSGCSELREVFFGEALTKIGYDTFKNCSALEAVNYTGSDSSFYNISGADQINTTINLGTRYRFMRLSIPVNGYTEDIECVSVEKLILNFTPRYEGGRITFVDVDIYDIDTVIDKELVITCIAKDGYFNKSSHAADIRDGLSAEVFSNGNAIKKCTKAVIFDGRIFLTGNPDLPNTVFFSEENNHLYFGSLNYFNDGKSGYSVRSLLPAQDNLIVFKSADDGSGSIFYHKREYSASKVRNVSYPAIFANSGIPALGDSAVFYDDALFISELGLCGLEKSSLGGVNAICRSHNVNQKLLSEDYGKIRFASWLGYLVLSVGGRMYLADSRNTFRHETGGREYEWFYLNGIGAPLSNKKKCFYHSISYPGCLKHELEDTEAPSNDTYTVQASSPHPLTEILITRVGGKAYTAYETDELTDCGISPCCEILSVGELLFFGCDDGSIMLFNNDKRGKAPKRLTENDSSLDSEIYSRLGKGKIHSDFYSFAGYAPHYIIKTGKDCCDIPYLEKNTTPASLTIKYKSFLGARMFCSYSTNREADEDTKGFPSGNLCFDSLNFANLTFESSEAPTAASFTAPKKWIDKELTVSSYGYRSPIGIYSITYRYKINGRIKKR